MSIKTKMTAIADKLRAMLGTTDSLTLDGMAASLDTQAAQVAASFSAVAEKGGTVPVSQLASTLPDAIRTIPSGVEVQTASGSFTTTTKGVGTINCGFQPDLIVLYVSTTTVDGVRYENNLSLAIAERKQTSGHTLNNLSWYDDANLMEVELTSLSGSGATLLLAGYDASWNYGYASRRTFSWKAVKYTA